MCLTCGLRDTGYVITIFFFIWAHNVIKLYVMPMNTYIFYSQLIYKCVIDVDHKCEPDSI